MKTTEKVGFEKLSTQDTRKLVAEVIASHVQASPEASKKVKPVAIATGNLQKLSGEVLATADRSQLVEFQAVLQQKLAEIEAVLQDLSSD
jgi:ParB family chromosome partitioning protein